MSILLEALRKSEQQRRLGETPSIHSPTAEAQTAVASGPIWIPALLVSLSLLAMTWFGWQQYRTPEGMTPSAESAALSAESVSPDSAAGQAEVAAQMGDGASDREAIAGSQQPVKPGLVAAPRPAQRTPVESFQADREPSGRADAPPRSTPPPPSSRPGEPRANPSSQQYAARSQVSTAPGSSAPQRPASQNDTARAAVDTAPVEQVETTPHEPEPITYWELPQSVRDGMPEMRITVLVFAEQPENRFLLIGGERLVEGDEYQSGVTLKEIRRGGAVFVYRNYQFLVKG